MPLETFGAVLSFAAERETADGEYFRILAARAGEGALGACLAALAQDCARSARAALRARQENVTEMILEPIRGLRREAFPPPGPPPDDPAPASLAAAARERAARAEHFYTAAAEALRALPEVARTLKSLGKKRRAHREALERLAS